MSDSPRKTMIVSLLTLQVPGMLAFSVFLTSGLLVHQHHLERSLLVEVAFLLLAFLTWVVITILIAIRMSDCLEWFLWRFGIVQSTSSRAEDYGVPSELRAWAQRLDERAELMLLRSCRLTGVALIHEFGRKLDRIHIRTSALAGADEGLIPGSHRQLLLQDTESARNYLSALKSLINGAITEIEPFDICTVIDEVIDALPPESGRRLNIQREPPVKALVKGVRPLLLAAVTNIVQNALVHTSGPVTLCLRMRDENGRKIVALKVADFGKSLTEEQIQARFHLGTIDGDNRDGDHFGLGLPLSRIFIRMHSGDLRYIERRSKEEQKAFELTLPLAA